MESVGKKFSWEGGKIIGKKKLKKKKKVKGGGGSPPVSHVRCKKKEAVKGFRS